MTTQQVIRDNIRRTELFGHMVNTIEVQGETWYLAFSIFKAFGTKSVPSESFRQTYCRRFPGMRDWVISYGRLHEYCRYTMEHNRVKDKSELMRKIAMHPELPATTLAPVNLQKEAIVLPDTSTVEAATLKSIVESLGIGRVHGILQQLGLIPQPEECAAAAKAEKRKIVITVEY